MKKVGVARGYTDKSMPSTLRFHIPRSGVNHTSCEGNHRANEASPAVQPTLMHSKRYRPHDWGLGDEGTLEVDRKTLQRQEALGGSDTLG